MGTSAFPPPQKTGIAESASFWAHWPSTGELEGIRGTMTIGMEDGTRTWELVYTLPNRGS
jgi:hypothetical protein